MLAGAAFSAALGQPAKAVDEIQVYNAGIAAPGQFTIQQHLNYIPLGVKDPPFPGGLVSHNSINGTPEFAYGVTDWWEVGLYLPFAIQDQQFLSNSFKLRTLFVSPNAGERNFFYGVNFEFSFNSKHWDTTHFTSEIRPIVGWHLGQWDLFINPILDTSYDGVKNLDFAPSLRLAYNISENWAVAAEHYADFGPVRKFLPGSEQSHQLFAVMDYSGEPFDVEAGVGFGLTNASDHLTLKLILSRDLN